MKTIIKDKGQSGDGAIFALGNGGMCAYEDGPDVIQLFGPPYSSASFCELRLDGGADETSTIRQKRTAILTHTLFSGSQQIGLMHDFVNVDEDCFVRAISASTPVIFKLASDSGVTFTDNTPLYTEDGVSHAYLLYRPAGKAFYNDYPQPRKSFMQVLMTGNAEVQRTENGLTIKAGEGKSAIYCVGGTDYPSCRLASQRVLEQRYKSMLEKTNKAWLNFSAKRLPVEESIPADAPLRKELIGALDSVSALIKTQQAREGGVLAGYNYHMGYVRDQYGVFRCLVKLGYIEQAKDIIEFYFNTWKNNGMIRNAQCMGVPGIFHIHENDDVEITGYFVLQCMDYLTATGDEDYLRQLYPMLIWALDAQLRHLAHGMLPFNGDETYIAGGILPRYTLNDGSAEATMLMITGGRRLLDWAVSSRVAFKTDVEERRNKIEHAASLYRENFMRDGVLITNNPDRKKFAELPRFRHGVCEGCINGTARPNPYFFGWTERSPEGRYLCPDCMAHNRIPAAEDKTFVLQSVSLLPLYINSDLFTRDEISEMLRPVAESYAATGRLPSRPDGNTTVGYDYGLLLYTLTELNHPLARDVYERTLSVLDTSGAWTEYYSDGVSGGTRCRPWESGINIEALLKYAVKLNQY